MYSAEIEELLKKKGLRAGSRVKITKGKEAFEGILMPQTRLGDPNSLVLKLDNGYNIGIRLAKGLKIKKLKGGRRIGFRPADIEVERDPSKPTVEILGCGGTIASRVEYETGAVFPAFSPADLLLSFPELEECANVKGRKLFDLLSEDMAPAHWSIIANETAKAIKGRTDGVVLMHGTDTMHFTAAALSFMLQNLPIPVILVGAQRSSDRGSSDNAMNLYCATTAAVRSDIAEVSVCMHGSMNDDFCYLHQGTKVRKLHTSRRDAFKSVNAKPFARVWYSGQGKTKGQIEMLREDYNPASNGKGKARVDDKCNGNVMLFHTYPSPKPEFVDSLRSFDGVVIAGTGLGHVPSNPFKDEYARSIVPNIKDLIESGIPVIIAPQTIFGRLNMDVYTAGRVLNEIGVIGNGKDWLPETALVKLMWVLGHTKNMDKIREMMEKNYAGEFTPRTEVE